MLTRLASIGGLSLILFVCPAMADSEKEAMDAIVKATSKQFGIEQMIGNWVKKQIPDKYVKVAEHIAPIVQATRTGTIQLTWEIE